MQIKTSNSTEIMHKSQVTPNHSVTHCALSSIHNNILSANTCNKKQIYFPVTFQTETSQKL
jgi:hypothetical protein